MVVGILVVFALLFVLFMGGFIAFFVWGIKSTKKETGALLAQIAQQTGLRFDGGVVWGAVRGRDVRARIISFQSGSFCVEVRLDPPVDLGMTVLGRENEYHFETMGLPAGFPVAGGQEFRSGDPQLDRVYQLKADEPERLRALFTPELRALLFTDLGEYGEIRLTDGGCEIRDATSLPGPYGGSSGATWRDPATLASRIELAVRIVEAVDRARLQVPAATALQPQLATWRAFADAHGLKGSHTPLAVWGTIDEINVWACAHRANTGQYRLAVHLSFPSSLELGLHVGPERADGYQAWDVQLGDPPFDQAFRVMLADPSKAQRVLSAGVRQELLEVHQELGAIHLDDHGLQVQLATAYDDPSKVPQIVKRAAPVLGTIHANAAALRGQGPYR